MSPVQIASVETRPCFASLFPPLGGVCQEDLASNSEDIRRTESGEERRQEVLMDDHVVVKQDQDVVCRCGNAEIISPRKIFVDRTANDSHLGKMIPQVFFRPVSAAVVDHDDFMVASLKLHGSDQRGKRFGQ